ncbi:ISAs1 family transposase [Lacunimicrobium album]
MDPDAFQACFHGWIAGLREAAQEDQDFGRHIISIDGKADRRSHERARGVRPLHAVSVWSGDYGLTLVQVACEEESNEIAAIPEAIKLIDCNEAIVTIDAMGYISTRRADHRGVRRLRARPQRQP